MYLMPYDKNLVCPKETETVITNVGGEEVKAKIEKGMPPSVAHRIRWYLREHGISQRELAERMGTISQGQISHCLLGRYTLTRERVDEICKALEITYEELMGESGEPMVNTCSDPETVEPMVNTCSEEAEDGVIEETKNDPIDEALKDINTVATAALEEVEETKKEDISMADSGLLDPLHAQVTGINPRVIYEDMKETMLKEFQEEIRRACKVSYREEPHPHQRLVDELKKAAETIIKNAESMIGTEKSLGDVMITIHLRQHEVPRINVDKDVYPEW